MRETTRYRLTLIGCILATSLAFGCQAPSLTGPREPRVVVDYGTMNFRSDADLAIVLDYRALLNDGYSVLQAASPGQLKKISARVVGKNMPFEQTVEVDCSQVANGLATLSFTLLPPGPVDVFVTALDDQGATIAYAQGSANIKPNETSRISLKCKTATGGLTIEFDCPGLGGCSGSSPTPTPTATPSPLGPVNPILEQRLGWINTIAADNQGGVILIGKDPGLVRVVDDPPSSTTAGKVIRVTHDLRIDTPDVLDDFAQASSGQVIGNSLYLYDNGNIRDYSPGIRRVTLTPPYADSELVTKPWNAFAMLGETSGGQLIFSSYAVGHTLPLSFYVGEPSQPTLHRSTTSDYYATQITGLTTDLADSPVWSSHFGIYTIDASGNQQRLVSGKYATIAPVDGPQGRSYLVSGKWNHVAGDTEFGNVVHFDPSSTSGPVPITVEPPVAEGVREIVRDSLGSYFLLIQDNDVRSHSYTDRFYVNKYRLEFDTQGKPKLVKTLDMVDTISPLSSTTP